MTPLKCKKIDFTSNEPTNHNHDQDNVIENILTDDRTKVFFFPPFLSSSTNISFESTNRFLLKTFTMRIPNTSKKRGGIGMLFVSNAQIDVDETSKYNNISKDQFKKLRGKPGAPVCYFQIKGGEREIKYTFRSPPTGKFILLKWMVGNGDWTTKEDGIEYIGFYGDIIHIPKTPQPKCKNNTQSSAEATSTIGVDDEPTNALSESSDEEPIDSLRDFPKFPLNQKRIKGKSTKSEERISRVGSYEDFADNAQSAASSPTNSPPTMY